MDEFGAAIGQDDDGQRFVAAFGIPGETVIVEVREETDAGIVGEVVEVLHSSADRAEPRCAHFGICGGCQLQHMEYGAQTELKTRTVRDQMRRLGGFLNAPISPMVGAASPWNYRNHARFTVRREGFAGFTHWFTHRFEPVDECHIMDPRINEVRSSLDGKLGKTARQLGVRVGANTSSYLIHPKLAPADSGELETGQTGHDEQLTGVSFRVSAASFFQVNTHQAERMVSLVRDGLRLGGADVLLDAYAGVGTFASLFSPLCSRVIAVEESAAAIRDAKQNLAGLPNVEIVEVRTEDYLEALDVRPDRVILDPPRSGCDPRVIDSIRRLRPERVVYVSCDPATLARDLRRLVLCGYRVENITPLDMFPQTYHIECVATLELAEAPLVLASTSPRRTELIGDLPASAQALAPVVDEPGPHPQQTPADYARTMAEAKASSLANEAVVPVLGADTVVIDPDGEVLGKPTDEKEAIIMLRSLRGREHTVITGVAVMDPTRDVVLSDTVETQVRMRHYSDAEIDSYVSSGAPLDKAGAYGIQDTLFAPVADIDGCRLNVVGLPLCLASRLLVESGTLTDVAEMESDGVKQRDCRYCQVPNSG
jgi:23S rRNA (uracil1939-C5)-methyltransferase